MSIIRIKSILMKFVAIVVTVVFTSCDNEPHYHLAYINRTDVQQKLTNAVSGEYSGKLLIRMRDGLEHNVELEDGIYIRKTLMDSIPNFRYTIGGYVSPYITFHEFPHRWVANVITDDNLKELVGELPNADINLIYRISSWWAGGSESHEGTISYSIIPIEFNTQKDGMRHTIKLEYTSQAGCMIDADNESTWNISQIDIDLNKVYIDGNEIAFNWNETSFSARVNGKRN